MTKLVERAMLTSLHISSYSGMMADKEVTEEVHEAFKADQAAGKYNKRLIALKFFKGVASASNVAKKIHRLYTLPWDDDGTRILTKTGFFKYTEKMKEAKRDFEDEVADFIKDLPAYIDEARTRLGSMFNEEDYPSKEELKNKFNFDIELRQLPDSKDFRVTLSDDQVKTITKDIERRTNQRLEKAVNDIFERIQQRVENVRDQLKKFSGDGSDGSRKVLRSTTIYSVFDLCELIPTLNVTDDPRIEALRKQLMDEIVNPASPEILRVDVKARQAAVKSAEDVLKKIKAYTK